MMETKQALAERRSIRKFADRPVDRETLTELVEAAWDNFRQNQPEAYVSPLPEDLKPDLEG